MGKRKANFIPLIVEKLIRHFCKHNDNLSLALAAKLQPRIEKDWACTRAPGSRVGTFTDNTGRLSVVGRESSSVDAITVKVVATRQD